MIDAGAKLYTELPPQFGNLSVNKCNIEIFVIVFKFYIFIRLTPELYYRGGHTKIYHHNNKI